MVYRVGGNERMLHAHARGQEPAGLPLPEVGWVAQDGTLHAHPGRRL